MPQPHIPFQAVVFDLDDTLYPERQFVRSGYRAVAEYLSETTGRNEPFDKWLWQRFLAGQTSRAFDALSDHFALGLSPDTIADLVDVYRFHRPDIQPYEDIPPLLEWIAARGRLGVISDGPARMQQQKFQALALPDVFEPSAVIFTDTLGEEFAKPHTRAFECIVERLGVPHEACVYIADNPAKDFLAPNRLGWRSVQYRRPEQIHTARPAPPGGRPDRVVRQANELIDALAD
jgi:putative hydrolase of the HAD superfamily